MNNTDSEPIHSLDKICACGSGKLAGECCAASQPCKCSSGIPAADCCYEHSIDEEEERD